jgi:hypothetical protein
MQKRGMTPENESDARTLTDWFWPDCELKADGQPEACCELSYVTLAVRESREVPKARCCYYVLDSARISLNGRINKRHTFDVRSLKFASS